MSKTLSPQELGKTEEWQIYGLGRGVGTTVPSSGAKGYSPGALWHVPNTTTALGGLYINIGSITSANFVPLTDAGSSLGFIDLPLQSWRAIASNDIGGMTGTPVSGILAVDTAPKLIRVNGATDKALNINWASSSSIEIQNQFAYPPDLDFSAAIVFHIAIKSGGATNTGAMVVGYFEGIGDTNRGGSTAVLTASYQDLTVSVTPTAGHPMFATVTLTPATHTTDTTVVKQTYLTYTKKAVTS